MPSTYSLGHLEAELQRLMLQARVLTPITERWLLAAGIKRGMRVLDIGCGAGDVTMLAADLVGPDGSVVGIDQSPDALTLARRRAQGRGNITFEQVAVDAYRGEAAFDMVVGRYVLLHQPDAVSFLRRAIDLAKPGGIVATQDITSSYPSMSAPHVPLWDQVATVIKRAVDAIMPNAARMLETPAAYRRSGLANVSTLFEVPNGGGKGAGIYAWAADSCRLFVERARASGPFEGDVPAFDGLAERLEADIAAADTQVTGWMQICVWGVVP